MVNAKDFIDTRSKTPRFQLGEAMFNMNAILFINLEGTNNVHDA